MLELAPINFMAIMLLGFVYKIVPIPRSNIELPKNAKLLALGTIPTVIKHQNHVFKSVPLIIIVRNKNMEIIPLQLVCMIVLQGHMLTPISKFV